MTHMDTKDARETQTLELLLDTIGAASVDPLIECTKDTCQRKARLAIAILGKIKDPRSGPAILPFLHDARWRYRATAAGSLGDLADSAYFVPLVEASRDSDFSVVRAALISLGKLKVNGVVDQLLVNLKHPNYTVRYAALYALKDQGATAAPLIQRRLENSQGVDRAYLAEALGRLKDESTLSTLTDLLEDRDPIVRAYAADVLANFPRQFALVNNLKRLLQDPSDLVRGRARIALEAFQQ